MTGKTLRFAAVLLVVLTTGALLARPFGQAGSSGQGDRSGDWIYYGGDARNWNGYGKEIRLGADIEEWQKLLLTDPQTSGGLLVSCSADTEAEVLAEFRKHGFDAACRIGSMVAGQGVSVE